MSASTPQFSPALQGYAHQYLLDYWIGERQLDNAMAHARRRFELAPTIPTAELMVDMLLSAELYDEAQQLMPWFRSFVPHRPYVEAYWIDNLYRIEHKIELARMGRAGSG